LRTATKRSIKNGERSNAHDDCLGENWGTGELEDWGTDGKLGELGDVGELGDGIPDALGIGGI
jgi:hypothetical protein